MKTLALVGKGLAGGLLGRGRGRGRGWKGQGMMTTEAFSVRAKEKKRGTVYHLGQVPYETAWTWQHELIKERFRDGSLPDVVLSLEHPSVYTIGRGGSYDHVKFDADSKEHTLIKVDRGGEVTYHGPGKAVETLSICVEESLLIGWWLVMGPCIYHRSAGHVPHFEPKAS